MTSVLQPWVQDLTFMQQGVLIASCRGPDGLPKEHVAKLVQRWLRRCFLVCAFGGYTFKDPYEPGGGSFTGPCTPAKHGFDIDGAVDAYLSSVDEVPHHYHLHLMHAAEIIGYKHPVPWIRAWWNKFYLRIVRDAHLNPETEKEMDFRLGDIEAQWRQAEEVVAK